MDMYDRIDELLKSKRMNRTTLSEQSGISYNTLSSLYKRRSKNVDIETIKKIAVVLDTTVEYLVTGNEKYKYRNSIEYSENYIVIVSNNIETRYELNETELQAVLTIIKSMKK